MKKQRIVLLLLVLYSGLLVKVMVFKDIPMIRLGHLRFSFGGTQTGPANFVPFRSIWPYLSGQGGLLVGGINLLGNIGLLVPVGFLAAYNFGKMRRGILFAFAVGCGLVIEGMQVLLRVGIFDVDDVILNGLGVLLGYWLLVVCRSRLANRV